MTRSLLLLALVTAATACAQIGPAPAPRCSAPATPAPLAPAATVCAHLDRLKCAVPDCPGAYNRYRAAASAAEFEGLVGCYMASRSCDEADQCAYACGPDGGPVALRPPPDAAAD